MDRNYVTFRIVQIIIPKYTELIEKLVFLQKRIYDATKFETQKEEFNIS